MATVVSFRDDAGNRCSVMGLRIARRQYSEIHISYSFTADDNTIQINHL
jgi:hypothetical protein